MNTATDVGNPIAALTAQIVSAYAANHTIDAGALQEITNSVYEALANPVGTSAVAARATMSLNPAVPAAKSVFTSHIVCLGCGRKLKMLTRHVRDAYGFTPEQYRTHWRLPAEYPMTAPEYSKVRSSLAKEFGLGKTTHTRGSSR